MTRDTGKKIHFKQLKNVIKYQTLLYQKHSNNFLNPINE